MELRRRDDPPPPAVGAERPAVETVDEHEARARRPKPGDDRRERRLPAARRALEQQTVARTAVSEHPTGAPERPAGVAEADVADVEDRGWTGRAGARLVDTAGGDGRARRGLEQRARLTPGDGRARELRQTSANRRSARPASSTPPRLTASDAAELPVTNAGARTPTREQPAIRAARRRAAPAPIDRAPTIGRDSPRDFDLHRRASDRGCSCASRVRWPATRSTSWLVISSRASTTGCVRRDRRRPRARPRVSTASTSTCAPPAAPSHEHAGRQEELDRRERGLQTAADRQRFDGFALDHPPEELARRPDGEPPPGRAAARRRAAAPSAAADAQRQRPASHVVSSCSGTTVASSSTQAVSQPQSVRPSSAPRPMSAHDTSQRRTARRAAPPGRPRRGSRRRDAAAG